MERLLAIILSLGILQMQVRLPETEAIDLAKTTIVQDVDRSLPRTTLAKWLLDLFGPLARTEWEVNDCGEQTGDPRVDQGRDFPMCVDGSVALGKDRVLHLLLVVGTFKTGVRHETPSFFYGCVTQAGVPTQWLHSLHEATTLAKAARHPLAADGAWCQCEAPRLRRDRQTAQSTGILWQRLRGRNAEASPTTCASS
jgi:hypothetical protein